MCYFDICELLPRKTVDLSDCFTNEYYKNKTVLITGGGGSIGSELAIQVALMKPRALILLDIYENGVYEVQQELLAYYGAKFLPEIEIASVCDRCALERIFDKHRPDVVFHAAAHKHVPLMEKNVCEAVKNNIFGTLNVVELSERYSVAKFIMISTDKAVNPTSVMGATKRFCEMIVRAHSAEDRATVFSSTRFGNVLGSAGSVVPLFIKQIKKGGPVTVTDKRITRYFMTVSEAIELVLRSGAMAENGELFVLDMGEQVRIYDLAEKIIELSGYEPHKDIEIVETGLRPGEKLYEEILVKPESLLKTNNSKIFVEKDQPYSLSELDNKIKILASALITEDDQVVKEALKSVVPTYREPIAQ